MNKCKCTRLELIAETATNTEPQDYCTDQAKTSYLECAECGKMYARMTEARTYEGYDTPGTKSIMRSEYDGSLSKEELMAHAKKYLGTITRQDEQNIVKLRN